jgi:hypothetical protein
MPIIHPDLRLDYKVATHPLEPGCAAWLEFQLTSVRGRPIDLLAREMGIPEQVLTHRANEFRKLSGIGREGFQYD